MAKGKEKDFRKKRGIGLRVPKRRNIPIYLKSKKLIVSKQLNKEKTVQSIQEALRLVSVGLAPARTNALRHLNNLIEGSCSEMLASLPEIFKEVPNIILDSDTSVRNAAINVLKTILNRTHNTEIQTFYPLLTRTLTCAMTHTNMRVKKDSLKVLKIMFCHFNLISKPEDILEKLVNLLRGQPYKKDSKLVRTRAPVLNCTNYVHSQDWCMQILEVINIFLEVLLQKRSEIVVDDENVIHWDCETPLHLMIYAGGGLKPLDIEKCLLPNWNAEISVLEEPEYFQAFLSDLMPLLSSIYIQEITNVSSKADDILVSPQTIENLHKIFEVLCHLGEWTKLLSNLELDKYFSNILNESILERMIFPFVSQLTGFKVEKYKNKSEVRLNLTVCYLYSIFTSSRKGAQCSFKEKMFDYLLKATEVSFVLEFVPILIKITKNFMWLGDEKDKKFICSLLLNMCSMMGEKMHEHENRKMLISLFVKLSLDPDYKFIMNEVVLKNWFSFLLGEIDKMLKEGKVNEKFLDDIKKIANYKYSDFLNCLEELDISVLKRYLKCGNEPIIDTVIFLIYNMRVISSELLEEISDAILTDSSFPPNMGFRLIRLLTPRFAAPDVPAKDRIKYIQFLLNIAMDTLNIYNETWAHYELPEFSNLSKHFQKKNFYVIYPSLHWKKHSKLFEVCCIALNCFPQTTVNHIAMCIIKEIVDQSVDGVFPIHSIIAMLRLSNSDMKEKYFLTIVQDLTFASLLFLSIFTSVDAVDEWYKWNVVELMNSLKLTRETALQMLQFGSNAKESIIIYYVLRIFKFFASRKLLLPSDRKEILAVFDKFVKNSEDGNVTNQPLFNRLVNFFGF